MGYPAFFPFSLLNRHLTSSLYIFLSASCVALSGCAGAHLYDTQNDGIAAGGKKNLAEAKLLEVIPAQVTNQDAMLAHELDAVRRYVNVQASADISHVIESKRPIAEVWVEDKVVTRLDALGFKGGDLDARLAELSNFHQKLQFVDQIGAQLRDISDAYFDGLKVFPPSCPADGRLPPLGEIADDGRTHAEVIIDKAVREGAPRDDAQALLPVFYGDFGGKCAELRAKQTELRTEGMISTALADYQGANQEIEQLRKAESRLKEVFNQRICALKTGSEDLNGENAGGCAKPEKQVEEARLPSEVFAEEITKIQEAIEALKSAAGVFGAEAVAGEQVAQIETILTAIAGGEVDGEAYSVGGKHISSLTAALLNFADDAAKLAAESNNAPVTVLVMEKQRQLALQVVARGRVDRQTKRRDLIKAKYDALIEESGLLLDAMKFYRWAQMAASGSAADSFAIHYLTGKRGTEAKERMTTALARYVSSITWARANYEEAEWRLINLDYKAAVQESHGSIAQWNALIAPAVDQLAAYHASGIKPEEIAGLLVQALGLGAIAVGVND